LVLLCCAGCTAPGITGKGAAADVQAADPGEKAGTSAAVVTGVGQKRTDSLLGIQVQDLADETIIRLAGNGAFHDYQFRRLGDDRFALELGDVTRKETLPTLPTSSKRARLVYADTQATQGVQIIGTLKGPLDRYVLNDVGNDLLLTLYLAETPVAPATVSAARTASADPAAKKSAVKPGGKAAAQAAAGKTAKPQTQTAKVQARTPEVPGTPETGDPLRKRYTGKPISLDLLDADLRNVLRLIADITGSNIVIEPDVTGKVTLKVEQVPWDQVLDMVLSMNDLGKEQLGNVIRVARQAKLKDEWKEQTQSLKAKQELIEATKDLGEISTAYLTVNYASPADIAAKISEIKSEKGKISVDERTSLILYSDFPARINAARELLGRLDKATPQVLIEARIVTMNSDLSRELGIDWKLQTSHITRSSTVPPFTQNFAVNSPPSSLFGFTWAQVIGETLVNVDLKLSALETATQLKVMAAPRVLTINNVKAVITQGTQIPYLQLSESGAVAATQFKDAVLELQVTPHITPDQKVRLEIQAKQDEPTSVTGATQPGIETRKIATELLVDDGNIVVIGGVIRNRDAYTRSATPGVHRIPIIGRLFKSESEETRRTEMLIFISPKIVEATRNPV
ncbi:MAG TPA: type IV pilus secretin PilQ, partial [Syntrophobacteraceae bacterium]|nr:type IV pilus secretin PilQ [Syntrophobacteraceae bacterium]